ncbi:MAG TPA: AAA family ATPase [Patescibacteria group bacterium]|nr:AAA family ATPase [Patescibacteria group bacterium]
MANQYSADQTLNALSQTLNTLPKEWQGGLPVKVTFDAKGVDYDAVGKGVGKVITESLSHMGHGMAEGTAEWGENAGRAGKHLAEAQAEFFKEAADGAEKSAPHLRTIQKSYVRSLIHPADVGSYAATFGMGFVISISLYYAGKILWQVFEQIVLKKIRKPRVLIRKKMGLWDRFKKLFSSKSQPEMILDQEVKDRLLKLVRITKKTNARMRKKNRSHSSYRNILLWGPPGTGKTMFARYLAEESGMDFAETTGGAFFQEGAGIVAIDELFDFAERSNRGLVIFIDEADSLFVDRALLKPGSEEHRIVNHFLNRLGQASNRFLLIAATNHKVVFDKAMARRIQELVYMPLPNQQTREQLIVLKYNELQQCEYEVATLCTDLKKIMTQENIQTIAEKIEGFSHADIASLFESIKTELQDVDEEDYEKSLVKHIIEEMIAQYKAKQVEFAQEKAAGYATNN